MTNSSNRTWCFCCRRFQPGIFSSAVGASDSASIRSRFTARVDNWTYSLTKSSRSNDAGVLCVGFL